MSELDAGAWIARESEHFVQLLDEAVLERRVPGCPDWTLRELAWHLGRVQRFWATVVRAGADVEPVFDAPVPGPADAAELRAWSSASSAALLSALDAADPTTPAWTWWRDDRTVGAIARHQVQEVAVHRWDAESSVGNAAVIPRDVALDGVAEFLWLARQLREPASIVFVASDGDLHESVSDAPPNVTVTGDASDLVLLLYGRIGADRVKVEGDRSILDAFLAPIA